MFWIQVPTSLVAMVESNPFLSSSSMHEVRSFREMLKKDRLK